MLAMSRVKRTRPPLAETSNFSLTLAPLKSMRSWPSWPSTMSLPSPGSHVEGVVAGAEERGVVAAVAVDEVVAVATGEKCLSGRPGRWHNALGQVGLTGADAALGSPCKPAREGCDVGHLVGGQDVESGARAQWSMLIRGVVVAFATLAVAALRVRRPRRCPDLLGQRQHQDDRAGQPRRYGRQRGIHQGRRRLPERGGGRTAPTSTGPSPTPTRSGGPTSTARAPTRPSSPAPTSPRGWRSPTATSTGPTPAMEPSAALTWSTALSTRGS